MSPVEGGIILWFGVVGVVLAVAAGDDRLYVTYSDDRRLGELMDEYTRPSPY